LLYYIVSKLPVVFYVYNGIEKSRTPKVVGVPQGPEKYPQVFGPALGVLF